MWLINSYQPNFDKHLRFTNSSIVPSEIESPIPGTFIVSAVTKRLTMRGMKWLTAEASDWCTQWKDRRLSWRVNLVDSHETPLQHRWLHWSHILLHCLQSGKFARTCLSEGRGIDFGILGKALRRQHCDAIHSSNSWGNWMHIYSSLIYFKFFPFYYLISC